MRTRLPIVLFLCLAAALPVSTASARAVVGISDNRPAMLSDPLFTALGVKQVRIVVAYNAVSAGQRGDDEISARVAPYIRAADAAGIQPLVAFEHARGNASEVCNKSRNRSKSQCRLPSVASYKAEITKFLVQFPSVRTITPWNEANHYTQATYRNPTRAGQFAKAVEQACRSLKRSCTVPTMDILDQAEHITSRHPTYKATTRYIKALRKAYGKRPSICGIHNYSDVNRFRTSGTRALIKAMNCKHYWLTETGGVYDFASFWHRSTKKAGRCRTSSSCQVKATRFLFAKTLKVSKRIDRVYIYNWFGGSEPRFDAGIVKGSGNTPRSKRRPAYAIVKGHV
ncbi:MAG: hypothetical protein ACR2NB_07065 [Solirubrobacteraceae bacterium]